MRAVDQEPGFARALGNTPSELNTFVGRERELARLRELLGDRRLITLVGLGGVGKTRLALRLQSEVANDFPDGAWVVDLSSIADPALVPQALGDVLGVRQPINQLWLHDLTRALRRRRLLLVLDNCEHLPGACAELAEGLLRACPDVHIVTTSIQPLGAAGETTFRVPPLSLPPVSAKGPHELQDSEAVRLFAARVRAHLPDFALAESNAALVAQICQQMDGLPLALELVSARVESLGLSEVATRLNDRFRLAVGVTRTSPPRQRTLRAALEWTCSLLDDDERVVLRRLGVFVGGWTLEAAQVVCAGDELADDGVVDVLEQLVTKSLVVAEHDELRVRYPAGNCARVRAGPAGVGE